MSFSVAGLASAIGSAGNIGQSLLGATGWLSYSSAKSLSKKTIAQQVAAEERLAREMPSAQVEGLRNANLNPILAVSHGLSTPSVGNGATTSPTSIDNNPVADFLAMRNVAAQNELLKAQKDSVDASTAKAYIDALNNLDTAGLGGTAGLVQRYSSSFAPSSHKVVQEGIGRMILQNLQKKFNLTLSHDSKSSHKSGSEMSVILENGDESTYRNDDNEPFKVKRNGDTYYFRKGENDPYKIIRGSRFLQNGR